MNGKAGWRAVARLAGLVLLAAVARAGDADGAEKLRRALAAKTAEADALRAELDRRRWDAAGGGVPAGPDGRGALETGPVRVLDVNRDLSLAVLNAGARQGVRTGMTFAVLRGDRVAARVRVTDVRREISGARIEERVAGLWPRMDDRLVPMGAPARQ